MQVNFYTYEQESQMKFYKNRNIDTSTHQRTSWYSNMNSQEELSVETCY